MSESGRNATYRIVQDESANPPITDMIVHAANVAMGQQATSRLLFDHLVGEHEQVVRNSEAERIGGLEVDNEIEFGRLLDRDIARLCPA
jgi:hypothetical protein